VLLTSKNQFSFFRTFCCIYFSLICFIVEAQQTIKANHKTSAAVKKVEALKKLSMHLSASDIDSSMLTARSAVKLAEQFKNDTCFCFSYMALGWSYYYAGNRDSAEYYLLKAINIAHKIYMPLFEGRCLLNLSYVYQDGAEYIKLLDCLKRARPLLEHDEDEMVLPLLDLTMGSTYGDMQQYEKGKQYIFSALAITKKLNRTDHLSSCYSGLGYLLMQQGNLDSALYYYRISYAVSVQLKDAESIAITADNLGEAFQKKAVFNCTYCIDSAYYYYNTALHWFTEMNSPGYIEYAKMNLGSILSTRKKYHTAEKYLLESFHYFDSLKDAKYAYTSAQLLSKLYESLKKYEQAYSYNIISLRYKDSLDAENRADSISKMFALYETEKRDRTIQLLNTKAALDKEEISRQRIIGLFSIISVVLIIILLVVITNRYRIKQQLKEVKVRNQLAADLHDEVGSSLSSILLLSKMAAAEKIEERSNSMLEKISSNTKEVIDKMGDIVWMMNPKYDEGSNVRDKLEQYVARIKDVALFNIHLQTDEALDTLKFSMEVRKNIFLIFKEAINNTLKYADAKNIFISLKLIEKNIELNIKDDGKGFNISAITYGNGLDTMAMRAKNCKGNYEINSAEGKGTLIKITIPLPHIRQKTLNN
jgi:two-component system, NarL family, sensor histidine kinase UhpB